MNSRKFDGWTITNIGSVCRVGDGAHGSLKRYNQGILYLTSKNFKDDGLDLSKVDYIDEGTYQKYFKEKSGALTKPIEGDVLFSIIGSIGTPYIVKSSDHFGMSSSVAMLRPDDSVIFSKYLFYWIKGHIFQDALYGIKGGVAQGYVSLEMIKSLPINYPSLPTQRRNADILSAYDDLIENNTRRIRILEQMAQAIYQEWFGKVDKETLPKGWEEKTLGYIAQDIRRNVHPNDIDPETPYFGLEHLPRKSIALSEWGKAGDVQSTKLAFKKGEILFGKIRPYFHKVGVAPLDGVASSDTIIIAPKSPEYFGLVLGCVFSEEFVNHATQTSQGTKMPRANWDVLVKYPVWVPPKKLLEQFNTTTKDFVELIQNLLFRNRNLRQTRDLLLPRLVSGEIDV